MKPLLCLWVNFCVEIACNSIKSTLDQGDPGSCPLPHWLAYRVSRYCKISLLWRIIWSQQGVVKIWRTIGFKAQGRTCWCCQLLKRGNIWENWELLSQNTRQGRKRSPKRERKMVGDSVNSALIPFKHNNKEDYKEEPQMKHRKDVMGKVQVGGMEGWL